MSAAPSLRAPLPIRYEEHADDTAPRAIAWPPCSRSPAPARSPASSRSRPRGCASDCARDCPIATAVIATTVNARPRQSSAWPGSGRPVRRSRPSCRGDDHSTFCNHINVTGHAQGICDVLIELDGREPMAVRIEFGPPSTQGCCKGYPVIGECVLHHPAVDGRGHLGRRRQQRRRPHPARRR